MLVMSDSVRVSKNLRSGRGVLLLCVLLRNWLADRPRRGEPTCSSRLPLERLASASRASRSSSCWRTCRVRSWLRASLWPRSRDSRREFLARVSSACCMPGSPAFCWDRRFSTRAV
uniref:Uncharacterized protein n=1 Tax=Ixodes ricinus TaxID=34613 RepID=A0A6B0UL79_IXORI